jgi:excisionase family DNA binding protein
MTDALAAEVARLNSIEQVQERLGVGRSTVFELLRSKKLRSTVIGRRRLVPEQSLRDFIAALDEQAGA